MGASWHILQLKTGAEALVQTRVEEAGATAYLPLCPQSTYIRKMRKRIWSDVPLIPGYLFVQVSHPRQLSGALGAESRGFLRNGDFSYAILGERAMGELHQAEIEARVLARTGKRRYDTPANRDLTDGTLVYVNTFHQVGIITESAGRSFTIEVGNRRISLAKADANRLLERIAA